MGIVSLRLRREMVRYIWALERHDCIGVLGPAFMRIGMIDARGRQSHDHVHGGVMPSMKTRYDTLI